VDRQRNAIVRRISLADRCGRNETLSDLSHRERLQKTEYTGVPLRSRGARLSPAQPFRAQRGNSWLRM